MKKKLSISVVDIMNRKSLPKNLRLTREHKKPNTPVRPSKPVRFQDLYKIAMQQENYNILPNHGMRQLSIYQPKRYSNSRTENTEQRGKKSSNPCSLTYGKKSQVSSWVSSLANSGKKTIPSTIPSHRIVESFKDNTNTYLNQNSSKQKQMITCTPQKHEQNIEKNTHNKLQKNNGYHQENQTILQFDNCLQNLNHQIHCHLRERNDCFLSENQIDYILFQLGYNLKCSKHHDLLNLLQVDIYGGAPSQNLKQVLKIIEQKSSSAHKNIKHLPKIIDNNLELIINQQNKALITNYFEDFKLQQQKKQIQTPPLNHQILKSYHHSIKKQTNDHNHQQTQQTYSSPNKKITNPVITQLIDALSHSQKIKQQNQENKKLSIIDEKKDENLGTFRKIEKFGLGQEDGDEYNFSRDLGRERKHQLKDEDDIIQLKNKLNQALRKSGFETNHYLDEGRQFHNLSNPISLKAPSKPILSIDVNLGDGISEKIIVYQGQTAKEVSERLSTKYTISQQTKLKFEKILQSHLSTMLWKIDEVSQEMLTDRTENEI